MKQPHILCDLTNLRVHHQVVRNVAINQCGTILNRTRQFIAYADDVAITGRTVGALNEVLMQLQTAVVSSRLVITCNTGLSI
jgi:predicted amidophosphoribosyltransferase